MAKNYGFARCLPGKEKEQELNRQIQDLRAAGAEEIICERDKPQLDYLLKFIEEGSSLYVTDACSLSKTVSGFCDILEVVKNKHLRLVITDTVTVDCRSSDMDPTSKAFLQTADIFNRLELSMIRARIKTGMAKARERGSRIGRKPVTKADLPSVFKKFYPSYMDGTMSVTDLARICELSRPTVYKYLRLMRECA